MIGIRREDKNRWERRAPLTPDHVGYLIRERGIRFRVQPFPRRAFPDIDYGAAGAELGEDLSAAAVILGVKEVPLEKLLPAKAYMFFSHVSKGQAYNMPMLAQVLELGCTLIDFELVTDEHGRRLIFFGRHAGHAGMIDSLWALGQRLSWEGHHTPFESVRRAHEYSSLDDAAEHISRIGERLRHVGLPQDLRPLVFAFTGSGNVSSGAQEIFDRLPSQEIAPEDLAVFASDPDRPKNLMYKVCLRREHRFERCDGTPFDASDLDSSPDRHVSAMGRWLPYVTVLINGAYWKPEHPRVVSVKQLQSLWSGAPQPRLRLIADVACDVGGGIETTVRTTTPSEPVYVYEIETGETPAGVAGRGPVMLTVDNLPCELPVESSQHFGDALVRFVPAVDRCDWSRSAEALRLPEELRRAVIAHRGQLTPRFAHLGRHLNPV